MHSCIFFHLRNIILLHSIFLTWYQSHCSNFLVSCSLDLLVFSTVSTSVVNKPFLVPSPDCPAPIRVPQDWISTARSSSSTTKTIAIIGSVTFDLRLGHKTHHREALQSLYTMPPDKSSSGHPHATSCRSKLRPNFPCASYATKVAPILLPLWPLDLSFSDLHFQRRIGFIR